jgi:hypothetical protein
LAGKGEREEHSATYGKLIGKGKRERRKAKRKKGKGGGILPFLTCDLVGRRPRREARPVFPALCRDLQSLLNLNLSGNSGTEEKRGEGREGKGREGKQAFAIVAG